MNKISRVMLYFCLILLIFVSSLSALRFELDEFEELPSDFTPEIGLSKNTNMNYSILKVETNEPIDLTLEEKIFEKETIDENEYYFYVAPSVKDLTFTALHYVPLTIQVPEGGLKIGSIYHVKLISHEDLMVTIDVNPPEAQIIVNGIRWKQPTGNLMPGLYQISLIANGYKEVQDTVFISSKNTVFNYQMIQTSKSSLTIKEINQDTLSPIHESFEIELNDYKIEMVKSNFSENTLIVTFSITNLIQDRDLSVVKSATKAIDSKGNEYIPTKLQFGENTKAWNITHTLEKDVQTELKLIFEDIEDDIELISILNLILWDKRSMDFKVSIKDIPVN